MQNQKQLEGVRILVVDDDELTCDALADVLGDAGAEVCVTMSAAEALRVIGDLLPHLLLCDIALPGEDGYSLIRKLRARGASSGGTVPAVALTALAGAGNRAAALSAGFQAHVPKPVEVDDLLKVVSDLIGRVV